MPGRISDKYLWLRRGFLALLLFAALTLACDAVAPLAAAPGASPAESSATTALRDPVSYGFWTLAPAVAAIVCAIATRQVIPSLVLGIVVAAAMIRPCLPAEEAFSSTPPVLGAIRITVERYIIGAMIDADHAKVMLFTMVIGGMVGVLAANGGTQAMVEKVAGRALSRRAGQLTTWMAGLLVFFDDYANTMIVGPTMRPICDRLRISRAKLAYIVDSTTAPVASIALVGTWVGAEIGYIQDGLNRLAANRPAFLDGVDGWQAFLRSIPYRFYPILALCFVAFIAITGRDFGPMRKAESRRRTEESDEPAAGDTHTTPRKDAPPSHWWLAAAPILTLVVVTFAVLLTPGIRAVSAAGSWTWGDLFAVADPFNSILYGALASATLAIVMTPLARAGSLRNALDGFMEGLVGMAPAVTVLVLAWAISAASQELQVGPVVSKWLGTQGFPLVWLPACVFITAAGVSFATGTSWGTMGILCPMVVVISAHLGEGVPAPEALALFYSSVGSVLAGAIFGDHCSPISDTTVLSSIASSCTLEEHVWTQLPYALVVALVSVTLGDSLCAHLHISPWLGLALGAAVLMIVVRVLGRKTGPIAGQ